MRPAGRARAGRRCWNTRLAGLTALSGHACRSARAGMPMTRPLAFGWTAVTRQACFPHGSLQPYHAPEAKPHHGDRGDAGQHHENPAKPRRSPHPGPGRRTLQSAGPSPGTPASGRLGWFRHERIAHNHAGAGPAAAPQAPNFATSQHEGDHPSQPHEPTAAGGDAAGAQECSRLAAAARRRATPIPASGKAIHLAACSADGW